MHHILQEVDLLEVALLGPAEAEVGPQQVHTEVSPWCPKEAEIVLLDHTGAEVAPLQDHMEVVLRGLIGAGVVHQQVPLRVGLQDRTEAEVVLQ